MVIKWPVAGYLFTESEYIRPKLFFHPIMTNSLSLPDDQLLLQVLASSKDATAIYTTEQLHIAFVNEGMLQLWGKDRSVTGRPLGEVLPEMQGQSLVALLQEVWHTGLPYVARNTPGSLLVNGELHTFYFDFEFRAMRNAAGQTYALLHTATDVTRERDAAALLRLREHKEQTLMQELAVRNDALTDLNNEQQVAIRQLHAANDALAFTESRLRYSHDQLTEHENRMRGIFEQAPVGMCILRGPEHIVEMANESILKIWGRTEAEVLGRPHHIARPELNGQPVYRWLDEVYRTGVRHRNQELRVMLYDRGGLREAFVNSVYQPILGAQGKVSGVVVILEEITDQVRTRREALKVQDMFNLAVEAGELATFYYNPDTDTLTGNEILKDWFGFGPEEAPALGRAIQTIAVEDREKVADRIRQALDPASGGLLDVEYTIVHPETKKPRMVKARGKTMFSEQQQAVSLNGTLLDMTERYQDEQRKNDFIGMVSHELKTPLTSLSGFVQLLHHKAQESGDQFTLTALDRAVNQIRKMTTMINGFLNISRFESGKIHLNYQQFDMEALIREVEADIRLVSSSHPIFFNGTCPVYVPADRDKIGQVIHNLLTNAMKYSPPGSPIVIACVQEAAAVQVSVRDEGMGVRKEDLERLFERYYRAEHAQMETIAGFGIGLYLCAEIIRRHNGQVWAGSNAGKGSTFFFRLPLEGAAGVAVAPEG